MRLLSAVAERVRRPDLLQAFSALSALLVFALAINWPGTGDPNHSWTGVAQVRSVTLLLLASYVGVFSAAGTTGRLETLLALPLVWLLTLPVEALAYAASYPPVPVWWLVAQPLLDVTAYFGVGLALGEATKRIAALWPLLPPLLFVGLLGASVGLELPLLNPLATAARVSWIHLAVSSALALATCAWCIRAKMTHGD